MQAGQRVLRAVACEIRRHCMRLWTSSLISLVEAPVGVRSRSRKRRPATRRDCGWRDGPGAPITTEKSWLAGLTLRDSTHRANLSLSQTIHRIQFLFHGFWAFARISSVSLARACIVRATEAWKRAAKCTAKIQITTDLSERQLLIHVRDNWIEIANQLLILEDGLGSDHRGDRPSAN